MSEVRELLAAAEFALQQLKRQANRSGVEGTNSEEIEALETAIERTRSVLEWG